MITIALASLLSIVNLSTSGCELSLRAEIGKPLRIELLGAESSAYPVKGVLGNEEYVLSAVMPDGNLTLDLTVCGTNEKQWEGGSLVEVAMRDTFYPLAVRLFFKSYEKYDIYEVWSEISNEGEKEIILTKYLSACLPLRRDNTHISYLYGSGANECLLQSEPLSFGTKTIKCTEGTRNSHSSHSEAMIGFGGVPKENEGTVLGAVLEWAGQYEMQFVTDESGSHRLLAGISPDCAEYHLSGGECLATPPLAFGWSSAGMGAVSRNFHRWVRAYRLSHPDRERKILLNSWEGVYLDVNEPVLKEMIRDISKIGGELFVLDDGWFGSKYSRVKPDNSLGDWTVDRKKLPGGLGPVIREAGKNNIGFGIWVEPEMVNSRSVLYETHPEWVLRAPNREPVYGRGGTQLVLDMSNPEVQDFVFSVFDGLLTEYPGIEYIKWDCNAKMSYGSQYLKYQSHLPVEFWRGVEVTCNRIREKYPEVTLQNCASGGARVSYGFLKWFDEFWPSDNTDPEQRIYIQWGTSLFYPAQAMACHIAAAPNRVTGGTAPLKYRIDVAMSGRLGVELQPSRLPEKERNQIARAISDYKKIRRTVQMGDLYRLVSPYDNRNVASLMYVSEDRNEAAFFWYKLNGFYGAPLPRILLRGLDPDKNYLVEELNRIDGNLDCHGKTYSGKYLMESGLDFPARHDIEKKENTCHASRVLKLTAINQTHIL